MKVGFVAGAFDLLHPGHVLMLRDCKNSCDSLIVGLHVNPNKERKYKNKPIQTVFERFVQLNALKDVDYIIPYETEEDLLNILKTADINIRFVGSDYLGNEDKITGLNLVPLEYIIRNHSFSSSSLRRRIKGW